MHTEKRETTRAIARDKHISKIKDIVWRKSILFASTRIGLSIALYRLPSLLFLAPVSPLCLSPFLALGKLGFSLHYIHFARRVGSALRATARAKHTTNKINFLQRPSCLAHLTRSLVLFCNAHLSLSSANRLLLYAYAAGIEKKVRT